MSKKYCIFSALYFPVDGEVERYTYYIAREIIKNGDKVTIVTSDLFDLPIHEIKDEIEIYRVPSIPFMNGRLANLQSYVILSVCLKPLTTIYSLVLFLP